MKPYILLLSIAASAASVDFDSVPTGTYESLTVGGLKITYTGGGHKFSVANEPIGGPINGHSIISHWLNPSNSAPFRFDVLEAGIRFFQIGVGDWGGDEDFAYLEVFDSEGNSLGGSSYMNPWFHIGGGFMHVMAESPIAYALAWHEGKYPGSVFWDSISYGETATPEPPTYGLLAAGLAGLSLWRRQRR